MNFDLTGLKLPDKVFYPVLSEILQSCGGNEGELREMLLARKNDLSPKHIIIEDIIASVSYIPESGTTA